MKCPFLMMGSYACPEVNPYDSSDCKKDACALWVPPLKENAAGACAIFITALQLSRKYMDSHLDPLI